jgi:hypothetical protein
MIFLAYSLNSSAYYNWLSLGVGTFTEQPNKIEESIGGETNSFEFNPYANLRFGFDGFLGHDTVLEVGLSTPRSSRDSAVTKINYWTSFLLQKNYTFFRPTYGVGFYFTRLSMDGAPQTLNNGGVSQEFQTPSSSSTALNNVLILGSDFLFDQNFYGALQVMVLNPEDSIERAINYFIALNFNL